MDDRRRDKPLFYCGFGRQVTTRSSGLCVRENGALKKVSAQNRRFRHAGTAGFLVPVADEVRNASKKGS